MVDFDVELIYNKILGNKKPPFGGIVIIDYLECSLFSCAFFIARKTLSLRLCCIELVLSYWCCCFSVDQAEVLQRSQLAIETNKVRLL